MIVWSVLCLVTFAQYTLDRDDTEAYTHIPYMTLHINMYNCTCRFA